LVDKVSHAAATHVMSGLLGVHDPGLKITSLAVAWTCRKAIAPSDLVAFYLAVLQAGVAAERAADVEAFVVCDVFQMAVAPRPLKGRRNEECFALATGRGRFGHFIAL